MVDNRDKKYKHLIKDTLIFAIGSIGSKLMLFLLVPLYTACLNPDEYGTADLIFTVSQLLIPILSLTIYDAVLRFGLAKNHSANQVLVCALGVWLIASLSTVFITPLFTFYNGVSRWKWYLCIYVIVQMFLYIQQSYLKTIEKNKLYAVVSILHATFLALLNIVLLLWANLKIEGYLLANILATAIVAAIVLVVTKMPKILFTTKFDGQLLKNMIMYSSPLILNNISWWGIQSANKIIIEGFLNDEDALGLFAVATKIPALINVLISIFSQAWGVSSIKEIESTKDTSFYSNVFSFYSFLAIGACICALTVIKPFMAIYVSKAYSEAWRYVPVLLLGAAFSAISSFCGSLYGALKKSFNNMMTTLIAAICGISFTLLLIGKLELWAAVWGTLISYFVLTVTRIFDVRRFIKYKINWVTFLLNLTIVVTQAILVTLNFAIYIVSVTAIILFAIINHKSVMQVIKRGKLNERS